MTEEEMRERIIRLEEQHIADREALSLERENRHGVRAEVIAIMAVVVSIISSFVVIYKGH